MEITYRAEKLYQAIEKHGDWMSRADIARATGKRQLSPHDCTLLARLVSDGFLEIRRVPLPRTRHFRYEYRVR